MMEKISNILLPIAEKLSKNRYLAAIRDGFVSIMPLVITASLFTLINCVFVGEGNYLDKWFGTPLTGFAQIGSVIGSASMSVMAILLTFTTAKALAKQYKMDTSILGSMAVVCFLCLTPFVSDAKIGEYVTTYYLGAAGMFTAFISALVS
ncbi:MAG: PTS transporter subunit EIIC, partial [Coprobacillus sp.]